MLHIILDLLCNKPIKCNQINESLAMASFEYKYYFLLLFFIFYSFFFYIELALPL